MASTSILNDEQRRDRALDQGEEMGFDRRLVSGVLTELLEAFENRWEHIEADNYAVLANQLLDQLSGNQDAEPPAISLKGKSSGEKQTESPATAANEGSSSSRKRHLRGAQSSQLKRKNTSKGKHPVQANTSEEMHVLSKEMHVPPRHDLEDISRGAESVSIPCVNDYNDEKLPDDFCYVAKSLVYQDAKLRVALATIGDNDCCKKCFNNCLRKMFPCACSHDMGGDFAYTREGLLKKSFLEQATKEVSGKMDRKVFCNGGCPMEVAKGTVRSKAKCKGHVLRSFVKECCDKCSCNMRRCGNRVVQQGIRRPLQVFWTPEGKGWGLRCAEELPAGAFVCEFVGEILTNTELYERNQQRRGGRHTYPVTLDSDLCSERLLNDDELLCLDATNYGNVARFINHRCEGANLQDVPVQIETPDRHYYHLAFFTNRTVKPYEELTWDYKMDFGDTDHPIEAFRCKCGSPNCRNP